MEKEILRRRPPILTLTNFERDLAAEIADREQSNRGIRVVLVTYNRVGEGLLENRIEHGNRILEVNSGKLMFSMTEAGEVSGLLTEEQAADFYGQVGTEFGRQMLFLNRPTTFVIYGGEGEKFKTALGLIEKLSRVKNGLVKFYLLTCNHDLAKKTAEASRLREQGRLESIVYNPGGACGGLGDLAVIAKVVVG